MLPSSVVAMCHQGGCERCRYLTAQNARVGAGMWDVAQVAGEDDDVVDVGVCSRLIQVAPSDFESASVLKEGGSDREAIVAAKRKEPQTIFCGKIVLGGEVVPANCALPLGKITSNLSIEVP